MKKFLIALVSLLLIGLIGYFFIYPYDYVVRFEADTFPGAIDQTVKLWHDQVGVSGTEVESNGFFELDQWVQAGDSVHLYHWEIKPITDSTSKVTVKIKDRDHSFFNKLQVPFGKTAIEASSTAKLRGYLQQLNEHIDLFQVRIVGESELPSTFYAYVDLETDQHGKAGGMMNNYQLLSDVLLSGGVNLNGPPMIVVDSWNRETDSLKFKFCFPIIRSDQLPRHPEVQYKRIFPERAIKAVYNGNYITSDRAWYALLRYAEKNGLEVEETPVEVFFNNPNFGGDATRWKAEVYLPLKGNE